MLRPAQFLGRFGRIDEALRPRMERHLACARAPRHRLSAARHRDHPAWPLDHHLGDIVGGRPDQRDAGVLVASRPFAHPFRPRARLAEPASGADQPHPPVPRRRDLPGMRPQRPAFSQFDGLRLAQPRQRAHPLLVGQRRQPRQQRSLVDARPCLAALRHAQSAFRRAIRRSTAFSARSNAALVSSIVTLVSGRPPRLNGLPSRRPR